MMKCNIKDYGLKPFSFNLRQCAIKNNDFRVALWTGKDMQITLMSIPMGKDIGLESHTGLEQMLIVESGSAVAHFGKRKEDYSETVNLKQGDAIMIPENTWHNVINTGCVPLKLVSVYAPPQHPFGTVEKEG